jgi:hypothetical protein
MRTDLMKLSALALALAAAPALAQGAPAAPPAPDAAPAPQVLGPQTAPVAPAAPRAEGSTISLNGYDVPRGKVIEGDVVVPFGDVHVEGEVMGDVTVGHGNLVLADGAVIHGNAVVNGGGQLVNEGGRVLGEMRVNSDEDAPVAAEARRARSEGREARMEARREAADAIRMRHGWMGTFGEGFEGLISTITLGLILCGIGAGLVFYALPQLERVSHVVRRDTAVSAGIGVAAGFLFVPAYIVGLVILCVTVIGIILAIPFAVLFPVAGIAASAFGIVGVAHAVGERTAEQSGSFASLRRNAYTYVFTGITLLLSPLLVGNALKMVPFLGWLGYLVNGFGWLVLWTAAAIGFGAVFITRAGTRRGWPWNPRPAGYDPIFDEEPAFDRSGSAAGV